MPAKNFYLAYKSLPVSWCEGNVETIAKGKKNSFPLLTTEQFCGCLKY